MNLNPSIWNYFRLIKAKKYTRKQDNKTCNLLRIPSKPSETVFYLYICINIGALRTEIFDSPSPIWLNPCYLIICESFASKTLLNLVFLSISIIHSRRTPERKDDIQLCKVSIWLRMMGRWFSPPRKPDSWPGEPTVCRLPSKIHQWISIFVN